MNVQELSQKEKQDINGGAWWVVVAACITAVNELGEIAHNVGVEVGEAIKESVDSTYSDL